MQELKMNYDEFTTKVPIMFGKVTASLAVLNVHS